jgi:hypothetical protein
MKSLSERFWEKVVKSDEGCWPWTGSLNSDGYGSIFVGPKRGKTGRATHVCLELHGHNRPSLKHHALHTCDNPSCVNPDHLWWGTHAENMADMRAKGRLDYSGFRKFWETPGVDRQHTHCKKGHELVGGNLYVSPKGRRQCHVCMKARKKAYRQPRLFAEPAAKPVQEAMDV